MQSWPAKDPDEVLDYNVDWTDRLETGETIVSSSFLLDEGDVVIGATDIVGAVTVVWLSAGTLGVTALVTNRITTSVGRTYDESVRLPLRSR